MVESWRRSLNHLRIRCYVCAALGMLAWASIPSSADATRPEPRRTRQPVPHLQYLSASNRLTFGVLQHTQIRQDHQQVMTMMGEHQRDPMVHEIAYTYGLGVNMHTVAVRLRRPMTIGQVSDALTAAGADSLVEGTDGRGLLHPERQAELVDYLDAHNQQILAAAAAESEAGALANAEGSHAGVIDLSDITMSPSSLRAGAARLTDLIFDNAANANRLIELDLTSDTAQLLRFLGVARSGLTAGRLESALMGKAREIERQAEEVSPFDDDWNPVVSKVPVGPVARAIELSVLMAETEGPILLQGQLDSETDQELHRMHVWQQIVQTAVDLPEAWDLFWPHQASTIQIADVRPNGRLEGYLNLVAPAFEVRPQVESSEHVFALEEGIALMEAAIQAGETITLDEVREWAELNGYQEAEGYQFMNAFRADHDTVLARFRKRQRRWSVKRDGTQTEDPAIVGENGSAIHLPGLRELYRLEEQTNALIARLKTLPEDAEHEEERQRIERQLEDLRDEWGAHERLYARVRRVLSERATHQGGEGSGGDGNGLGGRPRHEPTADERLQAVGEAVIPHLFREGITTTNRNGEQRTRRGEGRFYHTINRLDRAMADRGRRRGGGGGSNNGSGGGPKQMKLGEGPTRDAILAVTKPEWTIPNSKGEVAFLPTGDQVWLPAPEQFTVIKRTPDGTVAISDEQYAEEVALIDPSSFVVKNLRYQRPDQMTLPARNNLLGPLLRSVLAGVDHMAGTFADQSWYPEDMFSVNAHVRDQVEKRGGNSIALFTQLINGIRDQSDPNDGWVRIGRHYPPYLIPQNRDNGLFLYRGEGEKLEFNIRQVLDLLDLQNQLSQPEAAMAELVRRQVESDVKSSSQTGIIVSGQVLGNKHKDHLRDTQIALSLLLKQIGMDMFMRIIPTSDLSWEIRSRIVGQGQLRGMNSRVESWFGVNPLAVNPATQTHYYRGEVNPWGIAFAGEHLTEHVIVASETGTVQDDKGQVKGLASVQRNPGLSTAVMQEGADVKRGQPIFDATGIDDLASLITQAMSRGALTIAQSAPGVAEALNPVIIRAHDNNGQNRLVPVRSDAPGIVIGSASDLQRQ